MFIAISQFTIANDSVADVRAAFRNRPHLVDSAPGFVRMAVMNPPDQPDNIWLLTYWQDAWSFESWHRSHAYQTSHQLMPKGLKLVPGSTRLQTFEVFAE